MQLHFPLMTPILICGIRLCCSFHQQSENIFQLECFCLFRISTKSAPNDTLPSFTLFMEKKVVESPPHLPAAHKIGIHFLQKWYCFSLPSGAPIQAWVYVKSSTKTNMPTIRISAATHQYACHIRITFIRTGILYRIFTVTDLQCDNMCPLHSLE